MITTLYIGWLVPGLTREVGMASHRMYIQGDAIVGLPVSTQTRSTSMARVQHIRHDHERDVIRPKIVTTRSKHSIHTYIYALQDQPYYTS